jgi:hypothetical protein
MSISLQNFQFVFVLKKIGIPSSFNLQAQQEGGHQFHKIENF